MISDTEVLAYPGVPSRNVKPPRFGDRIPKILSIYCGHPSDFWYHLLHHPWNSGNYFIIPHRSFSASVPQFRPLLCSGPVDLPW